MNLLFSKNLYVIIYLIYSLLIIYFYLFNLNTGLLARLFLIITERCPALWWLPPAATILHHSLTAILAPTNHHRAPYHCV